MITDRQGITSSRLRWAMLVQAFPMLNRHLGHRGMNVTAEDVAAHARSAAVTSGSMQAAKFCLAVWSGSTDLKPWLLKTFDVVHALGVWDEVHRKVFVAWAEDPFWP